MKNFVLDYVNENEFKKLERALKKYKRKILEESKEKLSSEFKTVFLNNSSNISKEIFKCQAKVDDDGKIICKICVDYETKLNSYEEFLRYFHFDR